MKKTLIAIAGMFAVSLWVFAAAPPDVKTWDTPMGKVTFPHGGHVKAGLKCEQCHHMAKGEDKTPACTACHDAKEAKDKAPKLKDAMHKLCWDCHKTTADAGKKAGPVQKDCKLCHVKA